MIKDFANLEVRRSGGRVRSAAWYGDDDDAPLGEASSVNAHKRGFLEGLFVEAFEVAVADAAGVFQWRLYSARRGLRAGLVLSMASSEADLEAAKGDPLWMVGTLGREHLERPNFESDVAVDGRSLFFYGDERRVLIEGEDGDFWGSLERDVDARRWTLRLWDGRPLGSWEVEASDDTGVSGVLALEQGVEDALERAALEAIGVVRSVLVP